MSRDISTLRIGTRKSALALAQAELVRSEIIRLFPQVTIELVPMMTTGDLRTDRTLAEIGGKGLFTKELEEALQTGGVDLAVHSLKDVETTLKPTFVLAATLPRADARDAFIARGVTSIAELKEGARVGTSSLRRAAQLRISRPDLMVMPFRGNVQTRLEKLQRGEVDATLLAVAGLARLGKEDVITERLDLNAFIPAVGQGTIAIECRQSDDRLREMLDSLNHKATWVASMAERALLARLDGSCRTPIAAYAVIDDSGALSLQALIAKPDGSEFVRGQRTASAADAVQIGEALAEEMLAQGGRACLL